MLHQMVYLFATALGTIKYDVVWPMNDDWSTGFRTLHSFCYNSSLWNSFTSRISLKFLAVFDTLRYCG
jgi:hypothetical protein